MPIQSNIEVSLINNTGKILEKQQISSDLESYQINALRYPSGLYLLKLKMAGKVEIVKMIKI